MKGKMMENVENVPLGEDLEFREWLKDMLHEMNEDVIVTFTKADGTDREMRCTTSPSRIPEDKTPKGVRENTSEEIQRVFDLDKQEWRSFKWNSIKAVNFKLYGDE